MGEQQKDWIHKNPITPYMSAGNKDNICKAKQKFENVESTLKTKPSKKICILL